MSGEDNVTVGLTEETRLLLQRLREDGVFNEMLDAYRFGIALAIVRGQIAPKGLKFKTIYSFSSLDKDGLIRNIISELYPDAGKAPYSIAERLAEWGVAEIGRLHENGQLRFSDLGIGTSPGGASRL